MELFGIGNMLMISNVGPYFILQSGLILSFMNSKFINSIAKRYANNDQMRAIGVKVYKNSLFSNFLMLS